ncbi:MAG: CHAD domain-containing protein [Pseudomonadota bacterium]|nr:CHAD domain-containing protein [Pseudomonadota bacterium]
MAFHLKLGEDVAEGFRRIAIAQIEAGVEAADDPQAQDAAPHAIRKRCKKLRGLLRLVRGSFGDYSVEQGALRDAARKLATVREAGAHLEALERLCTRDPARYQGPDFEQAHDWLESQRDAAVRESREHECVQEARDMLRAQRERARHWTLRKEGFDAIEAGLLGTYRAARRALAEAGDDPTAHHLHELRKHVKYHRFHLDLLHQLWPPPLLAVVDEAEALGETLGEHHDIDVLLAALGQDDSAPAVKDATARIAVSVRPELARLEDAAFSAARRLLAEKPRGFESRMRAYWNADSS